MVACAVWSLVIYHVAIAQSLDESEVDRYIADVCPPPAGE
jgi:hypothetical protein